MSQASKVWVVVLYDIGIMDEDEMWKSAHRTEEGARLAVRAKMIAMLKEEDERVKALGMLDQRAKQLGLLNQEPRYSADMEHDNEKLVIEWTSMTRGDWHFDTHELPLLD
jgi:hypothetical protein